MRPIATSKTTTSTSTTTPTLTSTTATTFTALRRCIAGKMHLQLLCSIFLCCNNINININITFTGGQGREERLVKTGSSGAKGIHACDSSRAPGSRGWVWGWGWICEDGGSGRVMIPHFVAPTGFCCYLCFCIFLSFFFFVFLESWKVGKQPWQEMAFFTWSIKKRGKICIINTKRKRHEC